MDTLQDTTRALIPFMSFRIGSHDVQSVDGRVLHANLGLSRQYANWIRTWIKRANLVEHRDYEVFNADVKNSSGGRPTAEYALTIDAAKCIAMMSGGENGDKVREYFLACERVAQTSQPTLPTLHDPIAQSLLQVLIDHDKTKYELAQVKAHSERIEARVETIINNQNFWTVAEYVQYHGLRHQCPESAYIEASRHLQGYCKREHLNYRDPNIVPRRIPVGDKDWESEWGFHTSVYEAAFLPWLLRRNSQTTLTVLHGGEGLTHDPGVPYRRRTRR